MSHQYGATITDHDPEIGRSSDQISPSPHSNVGTGSLDLEQDGSHM